MKKSKIAKGALIGGAVTTVAGVIAGNYFFNTALQPDMSEVEIEPGDETWFQAQDPAEFITESYDGLQIHGDAVENGTGDKWVILAHGYMASARQMIPFGRHFHEMGYSIFMPDARGHGRSEGDYIGMGWHERKDMLTWIEYLCLEYDNPDIILYGVSMGAATVMATAGEDLPDNVKAVVEDCGYTSVWDEMKYQAEVRYNFPALPVVTAASLVTKWRAGYDFREASPLRQLEHTDLPILFIHGDEDDFVPTEMVHRLYDAASGPKEKYLVAGAAHGVAAETGGEEYWKRIGSFLRRYT